MGNVLSRETPTPPRVQLNPAGTLESQTSEPGFSGRGGASVGGRCYNVLPRPSSSANRIPSIFLAHWPSNHIFASAGYST